MNTDFRVSVDFFNHHKTIKLKKRIGNDGVLCLLHLWAYIAKARPSGDISGMTDEDIEISAGWEGDNGIFVCAAVDCGYLDRDESGYSIHDWREHNPWAADAVSRSDASRLSRMAKTHPALYEHLKGQGYKGISQKEYWALTHTEESFNDGSMKNNDRPTTVNEPLNESAQCVNGALSPAPSPAPAPVPDPVPEELGTGTIAPPKPGLSVGEREILGVLRTVEGGYTYDFEKDLGQVRKLAVEFPHVDILSEVKKIEAWAVDKPRGKIKNSRAFLRNWISKARAVPYQTPRNTGDVYASAAAEDPDVILATLFGGGQDSPRVVDVGSLREDSDFIEFEEVVQGG